MKQLLLLAALAGGLPARAQAPAHPPAPLLKPAVGPGTTLSYVFDLHGQHAAFALTVASATDTLKLSWRIRGLARGGYVISPAAWQHADQLHFAQPVPGRPVLLPGNQTFMLLSKSAFAALRTQHRCTYSNTVYNLQNDLAAHPLLLGGQPLDVLHALAEGDATELWILNNPDFPLICQLQHNPLGIDFVLTGIK